MKSMSFDWFKDDRENWTRNELELKSQTTNPHSWLRVLVATCGLGDVELY